MLSPNQQSPNQLSQAELNARNIDLLPILIAQQAALFPLYFYLPSWIVGLNLVVALVCYFSVIKRRWLLPTWLKVVLTVAGTVGVLATFHRLAGRDAGVALIAIMYALKILEVRTRRDVYVLLLLGFFVLLAGFLFSQSPLIVIYQLIPIAAIFNALTGIHSININQSLVDDSFATTVKRLMKYLLLAIPMMMILFVFFPRLSGPIWKMPGGSRATSGVSDTMSPGSVSGLQLSQEIAFRVKFEGDVPNPAEMYWRTLVLDDFDGFSWARTDGFHRRISLPEVIRSSNFSKLQQPYEYEISLEKTSQKWLTLLDRPTKIPAPAAIFADFSAQVGFRITDRLRYQANSVLDLPLNTQLSTALRTVSTRLPTSGNEQSKQWAIEERKNYSSDKRFILGVLSRINQQAYFYTLSPPLMQRNTVDSFWMEQKQGFCEHYSGALVFLARAAGIPARVVVGYQGAEKNPISDYWIVRYADAHAWTEIWFENEGWVRVDPTAAIAPHRVEEQLRTDYRHRESLFDDFGFGAVDIADIGAYKQLQYWLDQANSGWNDWVLDYGKDRQRDLLKGLGLSGLNSTQIVILMMLLLAVFLSWVSWKWLRTEASSDLLENAMEILIAKLSKANIKVDVSKGLSELALELKSDELKPDSQKTLNIDAKCYQQLINLLEDYYQLRYASINCPEIKQKDFRRRVKALKIRRSK